MAEDNSLQIFILFRCGSVLSFQAIRIEPFVNSLPTRKLWICHLLIFFQNQLFRKILLGKPSEYKTVWVQITSV